MYYYIVIFELNNNINHGLLKLAVEDVDKKYKTQSPEFVTHYLWHIFLFCKIQNLKNLNLGSSY